MDKHPGAVNHDVGTATVPCMTAHHDLAGTDEVLYEVSDHIATITLNAPGRMNTISGVMLDQLSERLLQADRDREVRCIVLTGAGKAFCAGLDMAAQMGASEGVAGQPGRRRRGHPRRARPADHPADGAAQPRHAHHLRAQRRRRRLRARRRPRLRHPRRVHHRQAEPRLRQAGHPARERRHLAAAAHGRLRQGGRDRVHRVARSPPTSRWNWAS